MDTTIETEDYASTATTTATTTTTQSEFSPSAANLTRRQIKQIEKDLYDNNFISARKASKMSANVADSLAGAYPDHPLKDPRRPNKREPRTLPSDDSKRDSKVQYTTGTHIDPNSESSSSPSYMLPIIFALVPPLGAIFYGSADLWSDILLLLLLGYYLYQTVKLPWELYYAARARRVFHDAHSPPGGGPAAATENTNKELPPHLQNHRGHASATLRRQELASLVLVVASPLLGGFILDYVRAHLSPHRTYITNFNITLFVLASSIRPMTHVASLFKKRALHLQEVVHYPTTEVEHLKHRLGKMEEDLATLKKSHATKKELSSNLTNVVQPELNSISKTLKRVEKKEQYLRSYSEERFQYMDNKIRDFDAFVAYQLEQEAIHKQVSLPVVALRTVTGVVFLPVNVVSWMLRGVGGVLPGMGKRKAIQ
jgi:hypothetical protein